MKRLRFYCKPWFILVILIGIYVRYFLRPSGNVFIDQYLNDCLSTPILFQLSSFTLSLLKRSAPQPLNTYQLGFGWIWISLHFEWLFPLLTEKATADLLDVFAYLAGTLFYYFLQKWMFSPAINRAD